MIKFSMLKPEPARATTRAPSHSRRACSIERRDALQRAARLCTGHRPSFQSTGPFAPVRCWPGAPTQTTTSASCTRSSASASAAAARCDAAARAPGACSCRKSPSGAAEAVRRAYSATSAGPAAAGGSSAQRGRKPAGSRRGTHLQHGAHAHGRGSVTRRLAARAAAALSAPSAWRVLFVCLPRRLVCSYQPAP